MAKAKRANETRRDNDGRLATRAIPLPDKGGDLPRLTKVNKENLKRDLQPGDVEDNDADTQREAG